MFYMRIAEMNIKVCNHFPYIENMCRDYVIPEPDHIDFTVTTTQEEVMAEGEGEGGNPAYLETLAVYRKVADRIIDLGGFLMHGAVIEVYGNGIMFTAKSGTGKSTHIRLWKKYFGKDCHIVNGDKPLIRLYDGTPTVYGTPWAGKEGWQANCSAPLKKVCFLERSPENHIKGISKNEAFQRMQSQLFFPRSGEKLAKTLESVNLFLQNTDFYVLGCNMDLEAARVASSGMGIVREQ